MPFLRNNLERRGKVERSACPCAVIRDVRLTGCANEWTDAVLVRRMGLLRYCQRRIDRFGLQAIRARLMRWHKRRSSSANIKAMSNGKDRFWSCSLAAHRRPEPLKQTCASACHRRQKPPPIKEPPQINERSRTSRANDTSRWPGRHESAPCCFAHANGFS
jgi:hypothetical protein